MAKRKLSKTPAAKAARKRRREAKKVATAKHRVKVSKPKKTRTAKQRAADVKAKHRYEGSALQKYNLAHGRGGKKVKKVAAPKHRGAVTAKHRGLSKTAKMANAIKFVYQKALQTAQMKRGRLGLTPSAAERNEAQAVTTRFKKAAAEKLAGHAGRKATAAAEAARLKKAATMLEID